MFPIGKDVQRRLKILRRHMTPEELEEAARLFNEEQGRQPPPLPAVHQCPRCAQHLEMVPVGDDPIPYGEGDIAVCRRCGAVLVYDPTHPGFLRGLTLTEWAYLRERPDGIYAQITAASKQHLERLYQDDPQLAEALPWGHPGPPRRPGHSQV